MSSDHNDPKDTSGVPSKTWHRRYDDRRKSSSPPSSDKILYCRGCLEKMHSLLQGPYVSRPSDLLQKREDTSKSFDGTVRFKQSQLSPVRGSFRRMNAGMRRKYDLGGRGRRGDR